MEEQIDGIREDVTEIKVGMKDNSKELRDAVKEFTNALANLHKDFLLRQEADKMTEQRDKERDDDRKHIGALEKRTSKLELWRSWIAGGLAVLIFAIGIVAELFHNGVIK